METLVIPVGSDVCCSFRWGTQTEEYLGIFEFDYFQLQLGSVILLIRLDVDLQIREFATRLLAVHASEKLKMWLFCPFGLPFTHVPGTHPSNQPLSAQLNSLTKVIVAQ